MSYFKLTDITDNEFLSLICHFVFSRSVLTVLSKLKISSCKEIYANKDGCYKDASFTSKYPPL